MKKHSFTGTLGAFWGLAGVLMLLGSATYRLTPLAIDAFSYPFRWYHWTALVIITVGMAYAEGYRGFQQGFSPRVAARAKYLREDPRVSRSILAPLFCMGYFHATRRRQITSITLTLGIILLVLGVRYVDQPWRGIIDAGVVVGLGWGVISLILFSIQAFGTGEFRYSADLPNKDR